MVIMKVILFENIYFQTIFINLIFGISNKSVRDQPNKCETILDFVLD